VSPDGRKRGLFYLWGERRGVTMKGENGFLGGKKRRFSERGGSSYEWGGEYLMLRIFSKESLVEEERGTIGVGTNEGGGLKLL